MKQRGGRLNHLGVLRGSGLLSSGEEQFGRANFEFDGYLKPDGIVSASGEIRMPAEALDRATRRNDLKLTTDEGRVLEVRFSGRRSGGPDDAAHADIAGDLPAPPHWKR